MSLFSRLFRGSKRRSVSKLDEFLSMIDRETIPARAKEVKSPELRVATTLSLLVLEQSGRFTRELFEALRQAPTGPSSAIQRSSSFDAAAFETAAFIHYSLLAKHLGVPGDDFDDDEEDEDDAYFVAARSAHHLTASILNSMVEFTVNDKVFGNRPIAYSMRAGRQASVEAFEGILVETIEKGSPAALRPGAVSLDLGLSVIAGIHARTFATTTLPALVDVAHNIVDHSAELGLE
jgi:hypothetical protein